MAYKIRIKTDAGREVLINVPGCGLMGNLDPISGVDVNISSSQSVNQIGESIDSQTVGSALRTIDGECLTALAAKMLLRALPPLATGVLILNDKYFTRFAVKKSPYVVRTAGSRNGRTFSALLFCPKPYWQSVDQVQAVIGGYIPSFRFPVNYSTTHCFGTRRPIAFYNVRNEGDFNADFETTFRVDSGQVVNPVLLNAMTGAKLRVIATLTAGQSLRIYRDNDQLMVVRVEHDIETDAFAALDDDSSLFDLAPGDNVLRAGAEDGSDNLQCTVSYYTTYMGVYPDDF